MKYPEREYLSVVLCTFNDEKFIRSSIESILNQTYPYFEFIIVNDGSTDGTLNIIKEFKDDRIIIIDKPNTGLADSLNIGCARAKYKWIARMDADDIALPTRFENQVKYIRNNIGVIGGQYIEISEDNQTNVPQRLPQSTWIIKAYLSLGVSKIIHPSALINKDALNMFDGYDANFVAAQDLDLWLRISRKFKIVNTNEVVIKYRINSNGITYKNPVKQSVNAMIALVKRKNNNNILTKEEYEYIKDRVMTSKLWLKILRVNDSLEYTRNSLMHKIKVMYLLVLRLILSCIVI